MERQLKSHPYNTWQLIRAFWQSEKRLLAYTFFISIMVMTVFLVGMEVIFNHWYNYFYNALQEYDKRSVMDLMIVFCFLASIWIIVQVYRYYITQSLGLRWRRWLTEQFINRWLQKRSYYYLETFEDATDNPDQRIQEDIGLLVTLSLELVVGLVNSVTTIFAFIYILWTLSGVLKIPLGSFGMLAIPGYLVWVGILYAFFGTFFTFQIGRPLINLNFEQQRKEADFRFAAVDLRTHSENVALYRGEKHQRGILGRLVDRFLQNYYMIILRQKKLLWFTAGYNQVAVLLPFVAALPNYFNKFFKLGGLMQTISAFRQIQDALSYLVTSYTRIAEWRAVNRRLITFLNHMYEVEDLAVVENNFQIKYLKEPKIITRNLSIFTPRHEKLLENISLEFLHGKNYLLKGVSGIGKSTFVRVLAGIWPFGSGEIQMPKGQKIMYLPQKPYMPLGTLKEALLFPDKMQMVADVDLQKLLRDCDLSELTERLHETAMWSLQLSPGEQQRISMIRVFIQKPDWICLDESTSALDLEKEKKMYQLLKTNLPRTSLISVGHRPSLESLHDEVVDLQVFSGRKIVEEMT